MNICWHCKRECDDFIGRITFNFLGHPVTVSKSRSECKECVERKFIELFREYGQGLVESVETGIKVNWPAVLEKQRHKDDSWDRATQILKAFGILAYESAGNWDLVALGPIGLNPRCFGSYLFFTRREDAMEFAKLEYGNALYYWEIRRIDQVITREYLK